jgi:hypothetical protein
MTHRGIALGVVVFGLMHSLSAQPGTKAALPDAARPALAGAAKPDPYAHVKALVPGFKPEQLDELTRRCATGMAPRACLVVRCASDPNGYECESLRLGVPRTEGGLTERGVEWHLMLLGTGSRPTREALRLYCRPQGAADWRKADLEYGVRALRFYAPFGKKKYAWKHELAEDLCAAPKATSSGRTPGITPPRASARTE